MQKAFGWFLLGAACGALVVQALHEAVKVQDKDLERYADDIESRLRELEAEA